MSKGNFTRLVRNIERTGRYEPLIVRPKGDVYEIINGRNRRRALRELGYETVDVIIWDIDDEQTDILLATLNRLGGSNVLEKRLALLRRLNERTKADDLAKLLPHTAGQIQRLVQIHSSGMVGTQSLNSARGKAVRSVFASPQVFFLNDAQQQVVEMALSLARGDRSEKSRAAKNAAALAAIARDFIEGGKRRNHRGQQGG
jgi:ParB/RepB/Spo0J family partition protein